MSYAYCSGHASYTAGCAQCRLAWAAYLAARRAADKRGRSARDAARRRLAAAHPEEYRGYLAEEVAARRPSREERPVTG